MQNVNCKANVEICTFENQVLTQWESTVGVSRMRQRQVTTLSPLCCPLLFHPPSWPGGQTDASSVDGDTRVGSATLRHRSARAAAAADGGGGSGRRWLQSAVDARPRRSVRCVGPGCGGCCYTDGHGADRICDAVVGGRARGRILTATGQVVTSGAESDGGGRRCEEGCCDAHRPTPV